MKTKLKQNDLELEQGRVLELRCRCTEIIAQGSKNESFECTKSVHDWGKHKPKGFARAIDLNHYELEFARILKQGAICGLE